MRRIKLAVISTHPIQYYAPVFRALAQNAELEARVFFTWSQTATGQVFDPGFGKSFTWNIPLLEGYDHVFVPNLAKHPGSDHFRGVQNPSLNRDISNWGATALLVFGWNLDSHLRALRYFKGRIPVLFRGDSTLLDPRSRLRTIGRRLWLGWVYSHIDVAIAVGQNNRDYYVWSGVESDRIALAPHSIDTARFKGLNDEHEAHGQSRREQLGIPKHAVALLFAGKFTAKKDPELLMKVFTSLESEAHLIMVGDGEMDNELRRCAANSSNIHFVPFQNQNEMPAVYRMGDVYVLPSCGPGETWGLAMNEAMASGRPVISGSRAGGARDLIEPGVTGWIFESGNAHELRLTLQTALQMGRSSLHDMGRQAQSRIGRWSNEAAAEGIAAAVFSACK